jgi:hypothetical protein
MRHIITAGAIELPGDIMAFARELRPFRSFVCVLLIFVGKWAQARILLRWLKLPEFQNSYRQAPRDAFGQAVARLQQGTSAAATTLLKVMIDPNAPASVRVRAAASVLNHATKAIEIEEIEARVAYYFENGNTHGFISDPSGHFTDVDYPSAVSTAPYGTNNLDQIVGDFITSTEQGFFRGALEFFDQHLTSRPRSTIKEKW